MKIAIDRILPNPEQPRSEFDSAELEKLSESIAEHGVIQPIVVEQAQDGYYILHDGERRWRAAKMAGLTEIPAHVTPSLNGSGKNDRLVRAMVANLQRSDLNIIEQAQAYQRMVEELGYSIARISRVLGVSQAHVSNALRILELETPIQEAIADKRLPKDARAVDALLSIQSSDVRVSLAARAADRRMTVKGLVEACKRVNDHLAEQSMSKNDIPAVHRAVCRSGTVDRKRWDALAQVGKVPPWILLEVSARDTCKKCSWYEAASEAVCKDCQLPQMIGMMIGKVNQ